MHCSIIINIYFTEKMVWIEFIAIVTFDIDEGQILEYIYPQNLEESEKKALCMSAFPDSNNSSHEYEENFMFRVKIRDQEYNVFSSFI